MNLNQNQKDKMEKLKAEFKTYKISRKEQLKKDLTDPNTYNFEKTSLKDECKRDIAKEKKQLKINTIHVKDPEFFKKDTAKRNVEKQILDLQMNYYAGLSNVERKLKRAKRIDKHDKSLKAERKQKIQETKLGIKQYRKEQKNVLKNEKERLELNNQVSKFREITNTSKVIGQRVYKKTIPVLTRIGTQKHLISIRDSFAALLPLIIIASVITIIQSIPISLVPQEMGPDGPIEDGIKRYLGDLFPADVTLGLNTINQLTMGVMAIGIAVAIGVNLGPKYGELPVVGGIVGFTGFILWVGITPDKGVALSDLGTKGMFTSLITSIIAVELFRIFKKYHITFKLPKQVPPAVADSFVAIIPVIVYATAVFLIRFIAGWELITGLQQLFEPLKNFMNNGFGPVVMITLLYSFFWWLGIHGGSITGAITTPFWNAGLLENNEWWHNGMIGSVPNMYVGPFYDALIYIGGGGSVLGLAIAAALVSKSKQNKAMVKTTTIPAIFNISEPIMFGYPAALNIYLFVPFLLCSTILGGTAAIWCNIFNTHWVVVSSWTLPGPIQAFLGSGNDWHGAVIGVINIIIATLIYMPFMKIYDKSLLKIEHEKDEEEAKTAGITLRELLIQREQARQEKKTKQNINLLKNRRSGNNV